MSLQVATLYGVKRLVLASATDWPTSRTSGAAAVPACCFTALTSSWLLPLGLADMTLIPYLSENALMMAP